MALFVALTLFAGNAVAEGLLQPAASTLSAEKRLELDADPYVMRWREAGMAVGRVFEPAAWDGPLALNLFADAEVEARVRRAKTLASGSRFLSGTLAGGGHFSMLRSAGGILRGEFHSAKGVFTMRSQGPGRVLVEQRDVSKLPGCGHDAALGEAAFPGLTAKALATRRPAPSFVRPQPPRATTDDEEDSNTVDVLVLYTQRVEDHEGGPDEVLARLEHEVAQMNQILENSGLGHRRIRGFFEKVDYEQKEIMAIDYDNLVWTEADHSSLQDGIDYSALDEVFPLIEEYQADLVHLFVRDPRGHAASLVFSQKVSIHGFERRIVQDQKIRIYVCTTSGAKDGEKRGLVSRRRNAFFLILFRMSWATILGIFITARTMYIASWRTRDFKESGPIETILLATWIRTTLRIAEGKRL